MSKKENENKELNEIEKSDDDFLKEIQNKINRRSKGFYYNKDINNFKRNLIVTTSILILVIIIFLILRFLSLSTVEKVEIKKKSSESIKRSIGKPIKNIKKEIKRDKVISIKEERVRYKFGNLTKESVPFIEKLMKKYGFLIKKDKIILLIPKKDKNILLKRLSEKKLSLTKETYVAKGVFEEFIFDKTLFPEISKRKKSKK